MTSLAHRARTRPHLARGARIVLPCSEKTAGKLLDIAVHDHVIIGSGTDAYVSLAQRGAL